MIDAFQWAMSHTQDLGELVLMFLAAGAAITRLTPTEKDDGFIMRLTEKVTWVLKAIGMPTIPNRKKGGGKH